MQEFLAVHTSESFDPGPLCAADAPGSLFVAEHTLTERRGSTTVVVRSIRPINQIFDGAAVCHGRVVRENPSPDILTAGRGMFAGVVRKRGGFRVYNDPLGLYLLYLWDDGQRVICSTNPHLLVSALAQFGVKPRRSVEHLSYELAFGSGVNGSTGYEGVRLLPFGKVLDFGKRVRLVAHPVNVYSGPGDIEQARAEIIENVTAAAEGDFRARVSDITGGFDSRLMMAAILAAGAQDAFAYRTTGSMATPDGNIAAHIRERYGLRRALFLATPSRPYNDPITSRRKDLFRTFGSMYGGFATSAGFTSDFGLVQLNGGIGETFRASLVKQAGAGARNLHIRQLQKRAAPFVAADVVDAQIAFFDRHYTERQKQGRTEFDALDQYYIEHRGPQFIGMGGRVRLGVRTHLFPLYSPAAVQAAFKLPNDLRAANAIGFSLIKSMAPELLTIPFEKAVWKRELWAGDPQEAVFAAMATVPKGAPPMATGVSPIETIDEPVYAPGEPPALSERDRAFLAAGEHKGQIALDKNTPLLLNLIDQGVFTGTPILEDGVLALLRQENKTNHEAMTVERLLRGAMWLAEQEIEEKLVF